VKKPENKNQRALWSQPKSQKPKSTRSALGIKSKVKFKVDPDSAFVMIEKGGVIYVDTPIKLNGQRWLNALKIVKAEFKMRNLRLVEFHERCTVDSWPVVVTAKESACN
jgi:hypothetical protein